MKIAFINYFDVKQRQIFVEIALLIHVKNAPPASMLTNNSLYFHFSEFSSKLVSVLN